MAISSNYKCQECGRGFKTTKAAEKATLLGCPGCGSVDIDLNVETRTGKDIERFETSPVVKKPTPKTPKKETTMPKAPKTPAAKKIPTPKGKTPAPAPKKAPKKPTAKNTPPKKEKTAPKSEAPSKPRGLKAPSDPLLGKRGPILRAMLKLKAVDGASARTKFDIAEKAGSEITPHDVQHHCYKDNDLFTGGYVAIARHEGVRVLMYHLTAKGVDLLK